MKGYKYFRIDFPGDCIFEGYLPEEVDAIKMITNE